MNTRRFFLNFTLFLVLAFNACSNEKLGDYSGIAKGNNSLKGILISYATWDDSKFGGNGAISISLSIKNESSRSIDNCTIIINGRYEASLKNIEYYDGVMKGNKPIGRDFIKPGETLKLLFSHDNNNHFVFKEGEKFFPNIDIINELKIVSDQGVCFWNFEPNF